MRSAVEETLRTAGVKANDRLVAAVSGGVDSLVLFHLLCKIAENNKFRLTVCHVDHQMRAESARDAQYVAELCNRWQIPCEIECVDVWSRVKQTGESPEEAARNLRYEALYRLSARLEGAKIVLAHHQDDQAETVLLHLLRGSGLGGLGGMRTARGILIRPLLSFTKREIEAYAKEQGLIPCVDMTNFDAKYLRNRIRHQLLPELESYQPQIGRTLCQLATLAQDEEDFMETATDGYWKRIVQVEDRRCEADREAFRHAPIAIQRRLVRRMVQTVLGAVGGLSFAHSERLRSMVISGHAGSVCPLLQTGILRCEYQKAVFEAERTDAMITLARRGLVIGEEVTVEEAGVTIRADVTDALDDQAEVVFDARQVAFPLHIRSRRAGDIIATRSATGKKKLKKELIDCKIAVLERDRIPLVCDANDTILWVVGVRAANVATVNSHTRQYLCLKSKRR